MSKVLPRIAKMIAETLGMQSPRGRLLLFAILSLAIYVSPYHYLAGLSLWQRLGIDAPSIGLTRAYWHVLHLDFAAAWERNPLIFLVLAIGLPLLAMDAYKLYRQHAGRSRTVKE